MPTTPMKNLFYRAALPLMSPSMKGQYSHQAEGLTGLREYERILARHHVAGASLLLKDGDRVAWAHTSCQRPAHHAGPGMMYRVASITKMATALVVLMACDEGLFTLDTPVRTLLPMGNSNELRGVTVRHLLSHTSGLADTGNLTSFLRRGKTFLDLLATPNVTACKPGEKMIYSNFGFGLLGCALESVYGQTVEEIFQTKLFKPLGMHATLDASRLGEALIMPIARMLPYKANREVTIPSLGRKPLTSPDPLRRYGHTAGAMYTDAPSLSRLLTLIAQGGQIDGQRLVSEALMREMTARQASTPTRTYGLGLVLLERPKLSSHPLLGHQGFAYGCVDGAFVEVGTGRQVIFLNGGASEARTGLLGLVNRDVLTWALRREMPSWT